MLGRLQMSTPLQVLFVWDLGQNTILNKSTTKFLKVNWCTNQGEVKYPLKKTCQDSSVRKAVG